MLRTIFLSACLAGSLAAQTPTPNPSNRWEKDIAAFEAQDKTSPPPQDAVLFVGSSSIRLWKTLAEDFAGLPVINRGFGGSEVADSLAFVDRIVLPYRPRVVVFYAGGNDLRRRETPESVLAHWKAFDQKVLAALPHTRIVHISINPTTKHFANDAEEREANRLLAAYVQTDPRLIFVDSYGKLIGPDGQPRPETLQADGSHLSAKGYEEWLAVLKPVVEQAYHQAGTRP